MTFFGMSEQCRGSPSKKNGDVHKEHHDWVRNNDVLTVAEDNG
jgi:hypothetical protein